MQKKTPKKKLFNFVSSHEGAGFGFSLHIDYVKTNVQDRIITMSPSRIKNWMFVGNAEAVKKIVLFTGLNKNPKIPKT